MARFLGKHATFECAALMPGLLYDLGQYPGAVYQPSASTFVKGQVWRMQEPDLLWPLLHAYEAYDPARPEHSEYRCALIDLFAEGPVERTWTYLYQGSTEGLSLIPDGDYLRYVEDNDTHQRFIQNE